MMLKEVKVDLHSFYKNKSNLRGGDKGKEGILERLVSDKTRTLKSTIKALLEETKIRERLNLYLLDNIDEAVCRQNTLLLGIDRTGSHYIFERFTELKNIQIHLKNSVLELEKEKRQEQLECWRDLMSLRKDLMMALREYWDLVKRQEMLSDDN